MRQYPNQWTLDGLMRSINSGTSASRDGKYWYPARPMGFGSIGNRLRCAWLVFTGRADALTWPGEQ